MPSRHVIIGSGIAAIAAAEAIRSADAGARITMISAEPYPFYSRPALARLLAGEIPESLLAIRTAEQVESLALDRIATHVRSIDPARHALTVTSGDVVEWDRLLIATGAETIPLAIAGGTTKGVMQLDGVRDANKMLEQARASRSAVVVGGGSTAVEIAEGLNARGLTTHYLMRGTRYWQRVLDDAESGLVEANLARAGVVLHRNTELVSALGDSGRLVAVETADGVRIDCDLLAVSTGVRPRSALAIAAGLRVDRGIVTDEFLATSAPDVFAAGDVAQFPDATRRRSTLDTLWASAELQGRSAGANMAGARRPHVQHVAVNVTRLAGIPTTIAGAVGGADDPDLLTISRGQSERWDAPPEASSLAGLRGDDRLRIVLHDGAVIGLLAMGVDQVTRPLARLVGRSLSAAAVERIRGATGGHAFDMLVDLCNAESGTGHVS